MASFDRLPTRVAVSEKESLKRLVSAALDAPLRLNARFVSAAATIDTADDCVYADGTLAYALTLPSAGAVTGRLFRVKRWKGASTITLTPNGSQTFDDGTATLSLTTSDAVTIQAVQRPDDSLGWMVL